MHDIHSGISVTGVIHFWDRTPMDWYPKKQCTPETATTYGLEFLAYCTCFKQDIDQKNYVWYFGAQLNENSFSWGDNELMINSVNVLEDLSYKRDIIFSPSILSEI